MGWEGIDPAKWAEDQQRNLVLVLQRALVLLGREMIRTKADGGTLPKVTGNLARSLLAQIGSPVHISDAETFAGTDVGIIAAQVGLGDVVFLGYQAAYAHRMNFGFVGMDKAGRTYNQPGNHFVERAISMWPQIVAQAVLDVKAGVSANA